MPVPVIRSSVWARRKGGETGGGAHGLWDRHCQKLNGLCDIHAGSSAPEKGVAASPPFALGGGRWSSAILSSATCMKTMMTAWMSRLESKRAPRQ